MLLLHQSELHKDVTKEGFVLSKLRSQTPVPELAEFKVKKKMKKKFFCVCSRTQTIGA